MRGGPDGAACFGGTTSVGALDGVAAGFTDGTANARRFGAAATATGGAVGTTGAGATDSSARGAGADGDSRSLITAGASAGTADDGVSTACSSPRNTAPSADASRAARTRASTKPPDRMRISSWAVTLPDSTPATTTDVASTSASTTPPSSTTSVPCSTSAPRSRPATTSSPSPRTLPSMVRPDSILLLMVLGGGRYSIRPAASRPSLPGRPLGLCSRAMTATGHDEPLRGDGDLLAVFERSYRPDKRAVGIESERVALYDDGSPLHYHSRATHPGVDALFAQLIERYGWTPTAPEKPGGPVLGLERDRANITLEPGSQFELSGAPHDSLHALHEELSTHRAEMLSLDTTPKLHLLGLGFQPYAKQDDLDWVPKSRYPIMRGYLPTRGPRALDMMRRTATVQANFDFGSERDAMRKLRAALGLSAAVSGLFANSPMKEGVRQAVKSERALVWLGMDPDRSGFLPFAWKKDASLGDYIRWALDAPMFLVKRDGVATQATTHTFRRFMAEGFEGQRATQGDWETHLKTMFPEVRLAHTLEVRGVDSVPLPYAAAMAALWTAVLYDDACLTAVEETFVPYGYDAWQSLRPRIAADGLLTPIGNTTVGALLRALLPTAVEALRRRALTGPDGGDERRYLDPILPLVADDRSVTDALLDGWTPEQPGACRALMARTEF